MRTFKALAVAALFAFSSQAAEAPTLSAPELETLPNGLTVAWYVDSRLPMLDLSLSLDAGYRDDPRGKAGVSELVAATLDRGAGGLSAQKIAEAVEKLGASRFAVSDEDSFAVGTHGLAIDAPVLLDILAKLALQPEFPAAEVTREHARLLDRWAHLGDYAEGLASLAFHRALAANSPYGRGNFLSISEFKKVKREDVVAYHRKHFTPASALLLVVGKVDRKEFGAKIREAFGGWTGKASKRADVKYADPDVAGKTKDTVILVHRDGLTQAQVRMGFRSPSIRSPDRYALTVLNALIGEYFHSRLNTVIRDQMGLTYGIGSSFSYSLDLATFSVRSATRNETVGPLVKKTEEILGSIHAGDISEEEVHTAKEYLVGGFPLGVATLNDIASRWLTGYRFDLGPEFLNGFVPRVSAVTREQVLAAARKHIDPKNLTVVIAGQGAAVEQSLKRAGIIRIKRIEPKDLMN